VFELEPEFEFDETRQTAEQRADELVDR
jgi:hypothetical protein